MKSFINKSKSTRPVNNFLIGTILLILIILVFNLFQNPLRNFFYLISYPIQKNFHQAGNKIFIFFETISEIKNLKKENEDLKLKLKEIISENIFLKELKKENEDLKTALNLDLEKEFKLIFSQVIGKDISEDSLIINKGLNDGVLSGQTVISGGKILVGRINEVYNNFSKVMLISHKKMSFDGEVSGGNVVGIIKGKGNFKILFDLIPKDKEIKTGDLVVTTSIGGIFPKGFLVGEIKEVKKSDLSPWQQAEILPFYDIKKLNYLFIITGQK